MAESVFRIKVISPRGIEVNDRTSDVNLPSVKGEMGVLPLHCNYTGLLEAGKVRYVSAAGGAVQQFEISGGFCTFKDDTLTLLVS